MSNSPKHQHHTANEKSAEHNSEHEQILELLKSIDQRLTALEKSPLQDGARVVTQGAKIVADTAKEVYERVEARKWFDKSYETAAAACDTLGQQFKSWWESRTEPTESTVHPKSDEHVEEGEILPKKEKSK